MSTNLFIDTIQVIKGYGWSLLCLLSMLHNYTYATVNWSFGYANPSIKGMADTLNIGETTVKKYINILKEQKLIQVINQESNYIGDNEFENFNSHYIVQNRIPDNKYYLDVFNKLIDSARGKQHSALADMSYV
jgi:DNA-binding transcriptional regulator YhcF (GntR family)